MEASNEMYTNKKRSENDQYNETSNHIQMKGGDGRGPGLGPPGRGTRPCRRTLSFVYGLMSHCIDPFHFVFYFYTFSFYASNVYLTYTFRIGSSKVGLRQQKKFDFSDWV